MLHRIRYSSAHGSSPFLVHSFQIPLLHGYAAGQHVRRTTVSGGMVQPRRYATKAGLFIKVHCHRLLGYIAGSRFSDSLCRRCDVKYTNVFDKAAEHGLLSRHRFVGMVPLGASDRHRYLRSTLTERGRTPQEPSTGTSPFSPTSKHSIQCSRIITFLPSATLYAIFFSLPPHPTFTREGVSCLSVLCHCFGPWRN